MSGPSGGGLITPVYLVNGIVDYTAPEAGTSGSSINHYIPFNFSYPYGGQYGTRGLSNLLPSGNICVPGDVCKLAPWSNLNTPTYGTSGESLSYILGTEPFTINSVTLTDWTPQLKNNWIISFMNYTGLQSLTTNTTLISNLVSYWESLNGFAMLSGPSVAYVNKDYSTNEVSVGMNVYVSKFFEDWAYLNPGPTSNQIRSLLIRQESNNTEYEIFYISNACKITYKGKTDIVWGFNGMVYDYDITNISPAPSLKTGGGNVFTEVRLDGHESIAHYLPKKFVHPDDPTLGLCSGVGSPFCIGDVIIIVDNSTWSGTSGTGEWQWVGDVSQIKYDLHIADIKNPCTDYKSVPISEMLFPLRVIQNCIFDDFD